MSQGNMTLTERFLFSFASPALVDATTKATPWISAGNLINATALLLCGATDITVDGFWQAATDSSGSGPATITGTAITQLTAAAGDDKQVAVQLEMSKVPAGYTHIRFIATAGDGTAGANLAIVVIGTPRHLPPTQPASLVEVIKFAG